MLVRIANREDPDQTASSTVGLSLFGRQIVFKILEHLQLSLYIFSKEQITWAR